MRTSNKILLITAAVVAVGIIASVLVTRVMVDRVVDLEDGAGSWNGPVERGAYVTEEFEVSDFQRLHFAGGWKARVMQGEDYKVTLRFPENYRPMLRVDRRGDTLALGLTRGVDMSGTHLEAEIVMPELAEVRNEGGLDLRLQGFYGDNLLLNSSGGSNIQASGGPYTRVIMELQGGTNIDFRDLPTENVEVNATGAANVRLNMRGGDLTGSISGAGSIKYTGEVRRQSIETSGVTSVGRLE